MKLSTYILAGCLVGCFLLSLFSCSGGNSVGEDTYSEGPEDYEKAMLWLDAYLAKEGSTSWDSAMTMPDEGCIKLELHYPGGRLKDLFRDSNAWHYAAGEILGIEPLVKDSVKWPLRRPLERVESNQLYKVDKLYYSYPYLVPEGKALLDEIALRFQDTLQARGGGPYRLKVTSLLRTRRSVSKLRRVNRASVDSSAHLFGTTFDISFTNFPYDGGEPHRTQEDLKNLLAEILYAVREEGKCYVIYEHKPGCFHVTARPPKE